MSRTVPKWTKTQWMSYGNTQKQLSRYVGSVKETGDIYNIAGTLVPHYHACPKRGLIN